VAAPSAAEPRPAAPAERAGGPPSGPPSALWSLLHLAALCSFALAQPLFDLLGRTPEFFAARGSSSFDIVSFSVLLLVVPPLLLLGIELLLGLAHRRLRFGAHLLFCGLLVALIVAPPLKKSIGAADWVLVALPLALGGAAAAAYARTAPARSFVSVLSPAPVVLLGLFLLGSPVSKLVFADEAKARTIGGVTRAPIVMVLLDELPSNTLMDERGRIDSERFPGFGELAGTGTWFPNAYTVYDSTERAQPAIMDGNLPDEDKLPTASDHPNSIFYLFGKTHRLHVSEEATSICAADLCGSDRESEGYPDRLSSLSEDLGLVWLHVVSPPDAEKELPSVSDNWGNFGGGAEEPGALATDDPQKRNTLVNLSGGRAKRFEAWIAGIEPGSKPPLAFKHALLPHVPWQYLPDGRRYRRQANDALPGASKQAYKYQSQLDVLIQRHYLQTGFADLELQHLWKHLRERGLWDDALIVVAADHGVAFELGRFERRRLGRDNAAELAPVPLLIKAPGQRRARVDDAYVSTIDILPTIFDVLDLDPRVEMDGSSAFSEEVQERRELVILERNTFEEIRIPAEEFDRERRAVIERRVKLLGTGRDGPDRIYRVGPNQELLGQPASAAGELLPMDFAYAPDYGNVGEDPTYVPIHVLGRVKGGTEDRREVAVAVNGTIVGVGSTFHLASGAEGELVSVLVPPDSFRRGANRVEVYEVR
jgi:hypothetical protein